MQLIQPKVQTSSSTTLPRRASHVTGVPTQSAGFWFRKRRRRGRALGDGRRREREQRHAEQRRGTAHA
jgi:hypothetical protein